MKRSRRKTVLCKFVVQPEETVSLECVHVSNTFDHPLEITVKMPGGLR